MPSAVKQQARGRGGEGGQNLISEAGLSKSSCNAQHMDNQRRAACLILEAHTVHEIDQASRLNDPHSTAKEENGCGAIWNWAKRR